MEPIVVAAAGNGNASLDDLRCMGKYDRTNPNRDSGATIVGAGGSGVTGCSPARQKLGFSTYGSRVDVHGWGECVVTTGYVVNTPIPPTPLTKINGRRVHFLEIQCFSFCCGSCCKYSRNCNETFRLPI